MTPAELRALARECADVGNERAFTEADCVVDEEWHDILVACMRLEHAAAILEGAP